MDSREIVSHSVRILLDWLRGCVLLCGAMVVLFDRIGSLLCEFRVCFVVLFCQL